MGLLPLGRVEEPLEEEYNKFFQRELAVPNKKRPPNPTVTSARSVCPFRGMRDPAYSSKNMIIRVYHRMLVKINETGGKKG